MFCASYKAYTRLVRVTKHRSSCMGLVPTMEGSTDGRGRRGSTGSTGSRCGTGSRGRSRVMRKEMFLPVMDVIAVEESKGGDTYNRSI